MRMRHLLAPVLCLAVAIATLGARDTVDARIKRIEHGLMPSVILKGETPRTASLVDRMRELQVPGVSVAVFNDGRIDWTRAWGMADVAARQAATPSTRFQAASISKPVAAVAVLALVERGRLSLDEDVNRYLKSWKVPEGDFTRSEKVTLRRLLTHSAGVTVSGFRGYASREGVPSLVQLLDGTAPSNSAPVRVDIPVGSRWRYSGGGFSIVQLLVEDITGKPFAQAARQLVLEPFGMDQSTYVQPLPADLRNRAATGYRAEGGAIDGRWHTYPEQAAAGLWTTPRDLARFALELQRMAAGRGQRVITRALAADMLRAEVDGWGLGVGVTGEGRAARFSHGGANEGFRCLLVGYRDTGAGIAIMTNSDNGGTIIQEIVRAAAREYAWPGIAPAAGTPDSAR